MCVNTHVSKHTCTHIDAATHGNNQTHKYAHVHTCKCMHAYTHELWHKTAMVILGQILGTDSAGQAALEF